MLLLTIDTSNAAGSITVARDGQMLGTVFTSKDEPYSSRLFRQLDFLLSELSLELSQVDMFGVVAGPGSFTGLRVGLTAVKGWAEVLEKPIVVLSGLEGVAMQSRRREPLVASMLDARRGQIYAALYRIEPEGVIREGDEEICTLEEFLGSLPGRIGDRSVGLVSPTPEILQASKVSASSWPQKVSREVERVSPLLAPFLTELAYARALRGEVTDALRLDANYIRRSDAEMHWKGRG